MVAIRKDHYLRLVTVPLLEGIDHVVPLMHVGLLFWWLYRPEATRERVLIEIDQVIHERRNRRWCRTDSH
jgi:hypothetical protein